MGNKYSVAMILIVTFRIDFVELIQQYASVWNNADEVSLIY